MNFYRHTPYHLILRCLGILHLNCRSFFKTRSYCFTRTKQSPGLTPVRLWLAVLELPRPKSSYLEKFGSPIRYKYVKKEWPISYYQTVYATEMGSAEMPPQGGRFRLK